MEDKTQQIKEKFQSIPNYAPYMSYLKESGFLAKGINSFGVFEYIDQNQNISYGVKTFIYNIDENMDYIFKYLNELANRKLALNCLVEYKGFYYEFSENQNSIKINVIFEKLSGDLITFIHDLSFNQIKKLIENLIFSNCELIGFGYVLQNNLSLKEIKYIQSNGNEIQVKFIKPYLIEKIKEYPSIQQFYSNNQINYTNIIKLEILILGCLILQILGNHTKTINNLFQTPLEFFKEFSSNNHINELFLTLEKGLEKENIPLSEIQQLMSILKQMVNPDESKILYPIQLYMQWLNFTNQQQLYPTQKQQNNNFSPKIKNKNLDVTEIQNSQMLVSDEQQAENIGKDQQNIQDDSAQENQNFNYPFSDELNNNKKYTYQSGATYIGEWLNKKRHGYGTFITVRGSQFIGNWAEDKFTGKGTVHYYSGAVLEGSWLNGLAQGYGVLKQQSGSVYEGYFENNKKNGFGFEKLANGTIYTGLFKNDDKYFGNFDFISGNHYIGSIAKGKFNGYGKLIWADGRVYQGNFLNNELDGPGIYNLVDGKVYQGCFKKNQYNGFGILCTPNGIEYGGAWVKNKLNGFGFYSNKGQAELVEWNNSKLVKKYGKKAKK